MSTYIHQEKRYHIEVFVVSTRQDSLAVPTDFLPERTQRMGLYAEIFGKTVKRTLLVSPDGPLFQAVSVLRRTPEMLIKGTTYCN